MLLLYFKFMHLIYGIMSYWVAGYFETAIYVHNYFLLFQNLIIQMSIYRTILKPRIFMNDIF